MDFTGYEPRSDSPLVDRALTASAPPRDLRGIPWVAGIGWGAHPDVGARENEGITSLRVNRSGMAWDLIPPVGFGAEFQVLRGDLAVLQATGVYRQDPAQTPQAATWCETQPGLFDPAVPEVGRGFFYLVTGWGSCETPLGFTSDGTLRPGSVCWGPCPLGAGLSHAGTAAGDPLPRTARE